MHYDHIIIGAGAAGLFCGAGFPQKVNGLILEKTKRIGTKLLMSGNGQCNITHDGSIKDFIPCYGKNGGRVRNCLYQYHNGHLRDFLQNNGVKTFVRDDGKVFPVSLDAKEIRDMLLEKCKQNGFALKLECEVTGLSFQQGRWLVQTNSGEYAAKSVILATGGCSYPTTGSDGSIFSVLSRDLGVEIVQPKPALSPLKVKEYPFTELAGISFANAEASIYHNEKRTAVNSGGLLFTHHDFSGPAIMNISKYGENGDILKLNYLAPRTYEEVLSILKNNLAGSKEHTANVLAKTFTLPKRFARIMADRFGNSPKELAKGLTADSFSITSIGNFRQAMATAGGISLSEVNTKTMEFKKHPGLFVIGEAMDIDGITGGYNLQFAYASARTVSSK